MRRRPKKANQPPQLMLSPMIDMIFLLLVFFIVGTMFVMIRAEEEVNYKTVIKLIDELRGAGVSRLGLATDLEDKYDR